MSIRNDFTIDWDASPRVIIIDSPSTECTMQDLLDTLRWLESRPTAMDKAPIVSASGKEPLGGGTLVGLTVSLLNAQIGFEARPGPDWVICDLSGGNMVAFDTDGETVIVPLYPTAYVSIAKTSSSSATLQEQDALNYASYGGMVSVDVDSANAGTVYPNGNQEYPVNNYPDAKLIATEKGFEVLGIRRTSTIETSDFSEFELIGRSHTNVALTIESAADVSKVVVRNCRLNGTLDGDTDVWDCVLGSLTYFNGHIHRSSFTGHIILAGGVAAYMANCSQENVENYPTLSIGGAGQDLTMVEYTGIITIYDCTDAGSSIGIGLSAGQIVLDTATCTAGFIHVSGIGRLVDELGNRITTGTWNGMTVVNDLTNKDIFANAVWIDRTESLHPDDKAGTVKRIDNNTQPI